MSCSPSSRCLSFKYCITNSRRYCSFFSAFLLQQSCIDININRSHFLQNRISTLFDPRPMRSSISVSCLSCFTSPIHARLFLLVCTVAIRAIWCSFVCSFVLQSGIPTNTDLYHFLQTPIASPVDPRVLIVFSASCSSGFVLPIPACLDLLVRLFCSHNQALRSVHIILTFLQTSIASPFDLRLLLIFFSVVCPSGFASQIHACLVSIDCSFALKITNGDQS